MTNDGHDTNIGVASTWERSFITPLLNNSYFMKDSLILLTFDENETYKKQNHIFAVLIGGAIPDNLKGTTDNTFYNHYSTIASVSQNWGLPSLGRWDCGANIFQIVANKTGYRNAVVDTSNLYFNWSYPGPLSNGAYTSNWPDPITTSSCSGGHGVLDAVKKSHPKPNLTLNYTNVYPYDAANKNNNAGTPVASTNVTSSAGTAAAASSKKAAASFSGPCVSLGIAGLLASILFGI